MIRNAVSFNDRPTLPMTSSVPAETPQKAIYLNLSKSKAANEQDDDFNRTDSSDDYDGVPRYEPPMIAPVVNLGCLEEKMDIDMENDLPQTQTVDDIQLQKPKLKRQSQSKTVCPELYDASHLALPKNKAVSFIDKNPSVLEAIEESPASRLHQKIDEDTDLNFEKLMQQNSPTQQMCVDDDEDGLPQTQEGNDVDVFLPQPEEVDSGEIEPSDSQAFEVVKKNSKSRSFAEGHQARRTI